jgi:hypothetical protein
MPERGAYFMLIAVLQSTVPLEEAVAMRLYHAAIALHAESGGRQRLAGDLVSGEVRRLGKTMLIGTIAGPAFEAEIDTPRGSGTVQFVVTPEGLARDEAPRAPPSMLN